jgi:hypothetical protein
MMAIPGSLAAEVISQQSSLVPSAQARFLLQIREHAITRLVACTSIKQYRCSTLLGQSPTSESGSRTCINVQTDICTASAVVRPHDIHIRAGTSLCPYGHVCLPTQADREPSRRSFARRYGIDTTMNHAL